MNKGQKGYAPPIKDWVSNQPYELLNLADSEDCVNTFVKSSYIDITYSASTGKVKRSSKNKLNFAVCGFNVDNDNDYRSIVSSEGYVNPQTAALYVERRIEERSVQRLYESGSALYNCSHFHNLRAPYRPIPALVCEMYPNPQYNQLHDWQ